MTKRIRLHWLYLPLLLGALVVKPAWAAGPIEQLRSFVAETSIATGTFQQVGDPGAGAGAISRGTFAFSRPGKFRWEVTEPYPQLLVADGKEVFFHDPDLNQVTVRAMTGALGATPAAILFGTGDLDDSFNMSVAEPVDDVQWLQAEPKVKDAGFERILIGFKDNMPVAMQVLDAFNKTTRFSFSKLKTNPKLAPDTFKFKIPDGADVVRQ